MKTNKDIYNQVSAYRTLQNPYIVHKWTLLLFSISLSVPIKE